MLLFGAISDSGWRAMSSGLGIMITAASSVMLISILLIKALPCLVKMVSAQIKTSWDGEFIRNDGSPFRIRYSFDDKGRPWFIARVVCIAVGEKAPGRAAPKCGGVLILTHGKHPCFSEAGVQAYLSRLAIDNHSAHRLLLNIRDNVLRILNKQRDNDKRYSPKSGKKDQV